MSDIFDVKNIGYISVIYIYHGYISWQHWIQGGLRRFASKTAITLKVVILPLLAGIAWKQLQTGTDILLIITRKSDKLLSGVNTDDLKWPWTPKIGGFGVCNLWLQRMQISRVNCDKMDGDRPKQTANRKC